jgi:membrane-associated phospholipid phosphatase
VVLLYIIAGLAVVVPAVSGPFLAYGPGRRIAASRAAEKTREATAGLVATLGRPVTALALLLAFSAATIVVFWPLGLLCHRLENVVDWPVLLWVTDRITPGFESVNWAYTAFGDRDPLKWVTVIGALIFAALWRRRFWIPLICIPLSFVLEQYVQSILGGMVARGHPPTGLGTYPSGGIGRIDMIIGALALFTALTWRLGRRGNVALGTFVLVAGVVEAYSRIYVQKHWLTDVIAGTLFGPALFFGYALAVCTLAGRYPSTGPTVPAIERDEQTAIERDEQTAIERDEQTGPVRAASAEPASLETAS